MLVPDDDIPYIIEALDARADYLRATKRDEQPFRQIAKRLKPKGRERGTSNEGDEETGIAKAVPGQEAFTMFRRRLSRKVASFVYSSSLAVTVHSYCQSAQCSSTLDVRVLQPSRLIRNAALSYTIGKVALEEKTCKQGIIVA